MAGNNQGPTKTVTIDLLIEYAADRMSSGMHKHALKRRMEKVFKQSISIASYERIRNKARKLIRERAKTTKDEHKSDALSFYKSIASDEDEPANVRIKAMQRMDEIMGIDASMTSDHEDFSAEEAREMLRQIEEDVDGDAEINADSEMDEADSTS